MTLIRHAGSNRIVRVADLGLCWWVLTLVVLLLLPCGTGCATLKQMALHHGQQKLDISKDSVGLLCVKLANEHHPAFQPYIMGIFVAGNHDGRGKKYSFFVGKPFREQRSEYTEYLISMQLPPGDYRLRSIYATGSIIGMYPVLVNLRIGQCFAPVEAAFTLTPQSVTYLGRIEAVIRKKTTADEEPAGFVLPLVDQALTGFATGTFDITTSDRYDADLALFNKEYPVIGRCSVNKAVLPEWQRPKRN